MNLALAMDPAINTGLRTALALLFAWAAFHKLRDVAAFRQALLNYQLIPMRMTAMTVALVIGAEVSIAFALPLVPDGSPAVAAAALLSLYTFAIGVNITRGRRDIDCGCVGPARRRPLSGALIGRNLILVGVALIASLPPAPRALLWVDAVTIIGAVAFLGILYATIDEVMANAPSLSLLRGAAGGQALKPPSPQALAASGWASGAHVLKPPSPQALEAMGGEAE